MLAEAPSPNTPPPAPRGTGANEAVAPSPLFVREGGREGRNGSTCSQGPSWSTAGPRPGRVPSVFRSMSLLGGTDPSVFSRGAAVSPVDSHPAGPARFRERDLRALPSCAPAEVSRPGVTGVRSACRAPATQLAFLSSGIWPWEEACCCSWRNPVPKGRACSQASPPCARALPNSTCSSEAGFCWS